MWPDLALTAELVTSLALARLISEFVLSRRVSRPAACVPLCAQAARVMTLRFRSATPSRFITRIVMLILCHCCACIVDCHLNAPSLSMRHLLRCLGRASLFVAPVAPLLAIGGSTVLMLCARCVQALHIGADLASLHWLVELGALHSPFWFIHARMRALAREPTLPLVTTPSSNTITRLRQQRLRHFCGM